MDQLLWVNRVSIECWLSIYWHADLVLPVIDVSWVLINPLTPGAFWTFWRFSAWIWAKLAPVYSKKAFETRQHVFLFISIAYYDIFAQVWQGIKVYILFFRQESDKRLFAFIKDFLFFLIFCLSFFSIPYLFAAVIDLNWVCFQFKNFWESVTMTGNCYHGAVTCRRSKFQLKFQSIEPITLIWVSLELIFPPAEVEYRWCQFWPEVMTSEVEQRPDLVTASTGIMGKGWSRVSINTQH